MPANNPFQIVYDALWDMMEEDARFAVKEGNKIKFNDNLREPYKSQHSTSDYPEVIFLPETGVGNISATSNTSSVSKRYTWIVSSGDYRYDTISDIEWALTAGLLSWMYRMKTLLWEGHEFVKMVNIVDTNLETIERARSQNIKGLIAFLTISVDMHFSSELIRGKHLVLGEG